MKNTRRIKADNICLVLIFVFILASCSTSNKEEKKENDIIIEENYDIDVDSFSEWNDKYSDILIDSIDENTFMNHSSNAYKSYYTGMVKNIRELRKKIIEEKNKKYIDRFYYLLEDVFALSYSKSGHAPMLGYINRKGFNHSINPFFILSLEKSAYSSLMVYINTVGLIGFSEIGIEKKLVSKEIKNGNTYYTYSVSFNAGLHNQDTFECSDCDSLYIDERTTYIKFSRPADSKEIVQPIKFSFYDQYGNVNTLRHELNIAD